MPVEYNANNLALEQPFHQNIQVLSSIRRFRVLCHIFWLLNHSDIPHYPTKPGKITESLPTTQTSPIISLCIIRQMKIVLKQAYSVINHKTPINCKQRKRLAPHPSDVMGQEASFYLLWPSGEIVGRTNRCLCTVWTGVPCTQCTTFIAVFIRFQKL